MFPFLSLRFLLLGLIANDQSGVTLKYAEASDLPDLAEFESFIPVRIPIESRGWFGVLGLMNRM